MEFPTKVLIAAVALLLAAVFLMPTVSAQDNPAQVGYTSEYRAIGQYAPITGNMVGHIRAATNVFTSEAQIYRGEDLIKTVPVQSDGTFEAYGLLPGVYTARVIDGNGGQPEAVQFTIVAGQQSTLQSEILGHAFSAQDAPAPDVIVITNASYGSMTRVYHPAVTHQDYEAGHVHAKKVNGFAHHDFYYNGHKYQIVGNQAEQAFIVHGYLSAHPAHLVTIVDQAAYTETIGAYADVKANVQAVVDGGDRTMVFNNAQSPGGIFVDGALKSVIADPAVGIVKSVHIEYTINGAAQVIDTMEYEELTI